MKKMIPTLLIGGALLFTACNQDAGKNKQEEHDMGTMSKDTINHVTATDEENVKPVSVAFTNVDSKAAASIKAIVDNYLHIKTALANDQPAEAANGAVTMSSAINKLDQSLLTAEQKIAFDKIEDQLKAHAASIKDNAGKIKEQRMHFALLSEGVYELVKSFGAGRPLYHDHCPMARENMGAMWLSEDKKINNPYFGAAMPDCGSVEEVIQ